MKAFSSTKSQRQISLKMKAICVTETRKLEIREVPTPSTPPPCYINVSIAASPIWGASAAGTVSKIGPDVPASYLNRKVAIYRGLKSNDKVIGLWCETAQVPFQTALLLPDNVDVKDYSGSLVNVATAYAFLETAKA